ncbi:MAG TPA: hypothetical protein VFJ90_14130 [Candidatus Didemnitutus sp.]|nr:hypothetical protein [Candidatus Didemnitutus sp.]
MTNAVGELWMWRHHGFLVGSKDWSAGVKVGTGWAGADVRHVAVG